MGRAMVRSSSELNETLHMVVSNGQRKEAGDCSPLPSRERPSEVGIVEVGGDISLVRLHRLEVELFGCFSTACNIARAASPTFVTSTATMPTPQSTT